MKKNIVIGFMGLAGATCETQDGVAKWCTTVTEPLTEAKSCKCQ